MLLILSFTTSVYSQTIGSLSDWEFSERIDIEREYLDTLVNLSSVRLSEYGFYEVYFLEIDSEDNLVFYDVIGSKLIYLPKGRIDDLRSIGYGEGRGPGEFRNPFDLKFDKNGDIWLADVERMEIQHWSRNGTFVKSFQIDKYARPAKLAITDRGFIYILSEQYTPEGIIYKYTSKGEKITSFQRPEVRDYRSVLYFEGDMDTIGEDLVLSGRVKPYMRRYSNKGELIYSRGIVGFKNIQNILIHEKKWRSRNKELLRATIDLQTTENMIYAGISNRNDRWMRIIDLYTENGEYKSSIRLPNPARNFAVSGNKIYTLEYNYDNKEIYLSEYRINKK